jgi:peroxiredoxin Q/BCP
MSRVADSKKVPVFSATATGGKTIRTNDLKGSVVVLYFYPKDNTPGCTQEGQDFRDNYRRFRSRNTILLGVSRDSLATHEKFKAKYGFPFDLIADEDESLCRLFDVIKEKNMYGKKVLGIERSTFLIDDEGVLRKAWRKIKVKGHADEVLDAVKAL